VEIFMFRFIVLTTLIACGGESAPSTPTTQPEPTQTAQPAPSQPAASTHGVVGAAPGSHEDWCGEHAVPESQCSRCNASLIPAFKATGDWCAEHGLPESQCHACNPDLVIERPPKEG